MTTFSRISKLLVLMLVITTQTSFGTRTISRTTDFAPQTFDTLYTEARLGLRQCAIAYAVHYISQNITNALYTITPEIEESIAAPFISLCQTLSAYKLTNSVCEEMVGPCNPFAHILGWVYATYTPKIASTVKDYLTADDCNFEEALEAEVADSEHNHYYVPTI